MVFSQQPKTFCHHWIGKPASTFLCSCLWHSWLTLSAEQPDSPLLSQNMVPRHHYSSWLSLFFHASFRCACFFPIVFWDYFQFFRCSLYGDSVIFPQFSDSAFVFLFYFKLMLYSHIKSSLRKSQEAFLFNLNFIYYWCAYCALIYMCHAACEHVKGQLSGVRSFFWPSDLYKCFYLLSVLICPGGTSSAIRKSMETLQQLSGYALVFKSSWSLIPLFCPLVSYNCFSPNIHLLHEEFFQSVHIFEKHRNLFNFMINF